MSIYINKNGQTSGPFEESTVLGWLKNGRLMPEDFACRYGAKEWQSLKSLFNGLPQVKRNPENLQGSVNQTVEEYSSMTDWARRNFSHPIEVKIKMGFTLGNCVVLMDSQGVTTKNGKKYPWETLQYVKFSYASRFGALLGLIPILFNVIFMGDDATVDTRLVFSDGKALISCLAGNHKKFAKLMRTAPIKQKGARARNKK